MESNDYVFSNKAYNDSQEQEKIKINTRKLQILKVENIKVDSQLKTCVRVSTENLFRGNILDFPIIDVIVNDRFVEITGLLTGKLYSGLILNLEYIDGNKHYLLDDFIIEAGDIISQYLCNTYRVAFNRDVKEEEFNEWYFRLQKESESINEFIKTIVKSDEFLTANKDMDSFIKILHKVVFRRDIDEQNFNYWKNKYAEIILKESEYKARESIIDSMIHYKKFEYFVG